MNQKHLLYMLLIIILLSSCNDTPIIETSKPLSTELEPIKRNEPNSMYIASMTETMPTNEVIPPLLTDPSIDIHFVGDIMMDSVIGDNIDKFGADYPWTDVSPVLTTANIAVANLETSVSTRGSTQKPLGYGFRSHPSTLSGLQNSGIDLVSLANNHVLDYGLDALSDTLEALKEYDIAAVGAGMNLQEAEQLKNLERNGLKVGFVSYTAIIPDPSWEAKADSPGIAPLRPKYHDHILAHLNKSDKECDILIVLLHWGMEHSDQIEEWQQELARKMIEHGADAIIGHHPHVLRGIEFYRNRPILYSIGNFVFLKRDDKAGRTAIFKLQLNLGGFVSGSIQPVHIQYGKANLLSPSSQMSKQIIADMKQISEPVGTVFNDAGQFYPFP